MMALNRRAFFRFTAAACAVPIVAKHDQLVKPLLDKSVNSSSAANKHASNGVLNIEMFGRKWPVPVWNDGCGNCTAIGNLVITVDEDTVVPAHVNLWFDEMFPELVSVTGKGSIPINLTGADVVLHAGDTLTLTWPDTALSVG